jgi:hypothetical protein
MAKIVEAKPLEWALNAFNFCPTLHIAAHFSGTLSLAARWALNRVRDATPSRAPIGDAKRWVNLPIFTSRENEMFRPMTRESFSPVV